jgi:hypothetical protein
MFTVDSHSNMSKSGELVWYIKDNHSIPYDSFLIKYTSFDLYTYYIIQIIKQNYDTSLYVLFERWGKLGVDECQHKSTVFSNETKCIEKFTKLFKQKTLNDYMTVHLNKEPFHLKPNKYNLVPYKQRIKYKLKDINFQLSSNIEYSIATGETCDSKLFLNEYKKLFLDLLDVNFFKSKYNNDMLPLTRLSQSLIESAVNLLLEKVKPLLDSKMELEKQRKKDESNR